MQFTFKRGAVVSTIFLVAPILAGLIFAVVARLTTHVDANSHAAAR